MQLFCQIPIDGPGSSQFATFDAVAQVVQAADQAGFDAVAVTDHPAPSQRWLENGGHPTLDPFVILTAAAMASARIKLLTYILVLAYRNPFLTAKAAASLDALSGGRLIMGIGTGYLRPEYAALGVNFEERGAITDEAIAIMRQAWTGKPVAHESLRFNARDAVVLPRPARPNGVPIWAGGNARLAIRRAVEMCEGWSPFAAAGLLSLTARTDELATIAQLREKLAYASEYADQIGRTDPLTICMGRLGDGSIIPFDRTSAEKTVEDYLQLAEAGIDWSPVDVRAASVNEFVETAQWVGEEIIAKVKRGR